VPYPLVSLASSAMRGQTPARSSLSTLAVPMERSNALAAARLPNACTHSHRCIENRSDACKIRAAAQSRGTTVPAWRGCFALFCMLGSASSAHAQRPDDFAGRLCR
jgi:hypothetical protein